VNFRKSVGQFRGYLELHKKGVLLIKEYLEKQGHRVLLNLDVVDTTVFTESHLKFQYDNDFDLYDLTLDKRIDVKTTFSDKIWINPKRIRYFMRYNIMLWWLFWETGEVIEVDPTTLDLNRKEGVVRYNRFGEKRLVFPKHIGCFLFKLPISGVEKP